jgi:hypothetical protein
VDIRWGENSKYNNNLDIKILYRSWRLKYLRDARPNDDTLLFYAYYNYYEDDYKNNKRFLISPSITSL